MITLLSTTTHLETIEIEPEQPATASIIWLHGLGADARDFYSVPPQLGLPAELCIRYVFPNAPQIPVTINMGSIMRAWYDVTGSVSRDEDRQRIRRSMAWINELVAREVDRGVAQDRIVLAGFSQGGAMALCAGLRYPEAVAGVMCLSGYLLLPETLQAEASEPNRQLPIFQAHGTQDTVVPYVLGRSGHDTLRAAGYPVAWHEYSMGHQVCLEELRDISDWLTHTLQRGSVSSAPRREPR